MVRNLTKTCENCLKSMRRDNLNRHMKKHEKEPIVEVDKYTAKCEICMKSMKKDNLKRHMKKYNFFFTKIRWKNVNIMMQEFNRKKEIGRKIKKDKEIQTSLKMVSQKNAERHCIYSTFMVKVVNCQSQI